MKAAFLFVVMVALFAMAMAGVHHYHVPADGHDSTHHGGSIFDRIAGGIDKGANAVKNVLG